MKNFFGFFLLLILCAGCFASVPPNIQTKLYSRMSEEEKTKFVSEQADKILAKFGRTADDRISASGLKLIKDSVDDYVKRSDSEEPNTCRSFNTNLSDMLNRGTEFSGKIRNVFSGNALPIELGIYTAMIESEFCPCMQSETGSLGMFQFTYATAKVYGLNAVKGSSPEKPDERCNPEAAAQAAAKYYKFIIAYIGSRPDSISYPLAISTYQRGQGATRIHIKEISQLTKAPRITFWMMLDTQAQVIEQYKKDNPATSSDDSEESEKNKLPPGMRQFQSENFKYVPKFFAAAIVGENPQAFGVDLPPLSESK